MKSDKIKKIATWIVVPLMASIFILDIITVALCNKYCERYEIKQENFNGENGDDRIHFLNTANSDAIILESNGHFAMIDSGEGNNNPRRKIEYHGFEKEVLDYIFKAAGDENGNVTFDFILGTHCHYDHIGNFHSIISNEKITIKKAYFKGFNSEYSKFFDEMWGLKEEYELILSDLSAKNVPVESVLPADSFSFGDFTVKFLNPANYDDLHGKGENAESVGVLITKCGKKAFLAADITRTSGLEDKLMDEIGDVDLLKAGHHGYYGSCSMKFMRTVKPDVTIVTNQLGKVYPNVKWNLTMVAKCPFYATFDNNGIIASFTDDGRIVLTGNIH